MTLIDARVTGASVQGSRALFCCCEASGRRLSGGGQAGHSVKAAGWGLGKGRLDIGSGMYDCRSFCRGHPSPLAPIKLEEEEKGKEGEEEE